MSEGAGSIWTNILIKYISAQEKVTQGYALHLNSSDPSADVGKGCSEHIGVYSKNLVKGEKGREKFNDVTFNLYIISLR